jgi:hypothetical protein
MCHFSTQFWTAPLRETVRSSSEKNAKWAEELDEDNTMAASSTTGFPVAVPATTVKAIRSRVNRRRSINPQAGRALELLGHAIEYLTDEFIHEGGSFSANNAQLQAVQLLMALNRQIYFDCPEVPPLGKRFLSLLHLNTA